MTRRRSRRRCAPRRSPAPASTCGRRSRRRSIIRCCKFDNVMVSPHTAGVTHEARVNMGRIAAEQMLAALDGKPVARVLNPEVWPRYAARFKETFGFEPQGIRVASVWRDRRSRPTGIGRPASKPEPPGSSRACRSSILAIAFGSPGSAVVALKPIAAETRRRALGAGVRDRARLVRQRPRRHRDGLARGPLRRALDRDVRQRDDRDRACDLVVRAADSGGNALYHRPWPVHRPARQLPVSMRRSMSMSAAGSTAGAARRSR